MINQEIDTQSSAAFRRGFFFWGGWGDVGVSVKKGSTMNVIVGTEKIMAKKFHSQ